MARVVWKFDMLISQLSQATTYNAHGYLQEYNIIEGGERVSYADIQNAEYPE